MSRLVSLLFFVVAVIAASTSCSSPENAGTSAAPIHGDGVNCGGGDNSTPCDNDVDDPVANATVKLCTFCTSPTACSPDPKCQGLQCSGTLISPTAVLTAAHCVVGFSGQAIQPRYAVIIGNHVEDSTGRPQNPGHNELDHVALQTTPVTPFVDVGHDIAIVFMNPTQSDGYELANAWAFRPSFATATPTTSETPANNCISAGLFTDIGGAGWDGVNFRTNVENTATSTSSQLGLEVCNAPTVGLYDDFFARGWGSDGGDSGGPLYIMRANLLPTEIGGSAGVAFRDVIATLHGKNDVSGVSYYTNIVDAQDANHPPLSTWIEQQMEEQTVVAGIQPHSQAWLTAHGKTLTSWKGEVDYVGKCLNPYVTGRTPTYKEYHDCLGSGGEDCDCDHWLNAHDDCPFAYDPDQTNTDDQTYGDACRRCPCDPDNDIDGDGVCAVLCPNQPGEVDNCPFVPNPDQANSNYDFEVANGQPILGDACDPVPTPVPNVSSHLVATGQCTFTQLCQNPTNLSPTCPSGCALNSDCLTCQCCGNAVSDSITTMTLGSHKRNDAAPVVKSQEQDVSVPSTYGRFCQEASGEVTIECHGFTGPSGSGGSLPDDNHVLNDFQINTTEPASPDPRFPWHRITTAAFSSNKVVQVVSDYVAPNRSYGDPVADFARVWEYQTDLDNWLAPVLPIIPGCASTNAACLNGIWWNSGLTETGKTVSYFTPFDTGIHIEGSMIGNIADSISPIEPVHGGIAWCPVPTPKFNLDPPPATGPIGWGPGRLAILPRSVSYTLDANNLPLDSRILVASTVGNVVAALQGDGSAISAENVGGSNCGGSSIDGVLHASLFGSVATWFGPVEPSNVIAGLSVDALALSIDGSRVTATAQTVNGILSAGSPVPGPAGDPPVARGGYAAVYSRWAGGIFVAGGQALSDSSELHDVWFGQPDGSWKEVTPHSWEGSSCPTCGAVRDLGVVDAITYSFADKNIWMVDEFPAKPFTMVRLLRALPGGAIDQVASWTRAGQAESYFLALDHDGTALLAIAKSSGQGFAAVRIEIDATGTAHVTARYSDASDKLLARPFVSPVGYAFLTQHGQQPPRTLRVPHLERVTAPRQIDDSLAP